MVFTPFGRESGGVGVCGTDIPYACESYSQKNELKPHLKRSWCIGQITSRFIARMEQILWLYALPYDPLYPVVCLDERPCFLIGDVIEPLAMQTGPVRKEHYDYAKLGSCTLFAAIEPLTGQRLAQIQVSNFKKYPPIQVVEWARIPAAPIYPDYDRDLLIAIAAALGLALFVTWLVEYLSGQAASPSGTPYLGVRIHHTDQLQGPQTGDSRLIDHPGSQPDARTASPVSTSTVPPTVTA